MGPSRCPVDVYLPGHTVQERQAPAWDDADRSAHLKSSANRKVRNICHALLRKVSPTPSHHTKHYITSLTDHNLLLLLAPTLPEYEH
jgi:hypothetical protein